MGDQANREDLDWNSLSNPVPLDLIENGFEPGTEAAPSIRPEPTPPIAPNPPTLQMPAHGGSGGTTFGVDWPQEQAAIQDEFSRIRAKMEAEAESEKKAKAEAEKEEASQRDRLEQWMANARNRLLKADADLTGPSARIRIRKDHSPSLYRLAEMQKTIWVEGQATQIDSPNAAIGSAKPKPPAPPLDPMATISVPTEQFLTLDAPAQPTMREQALARQAQQQAAAQAAAQQAAQTSAKTSVKPSAKPASLAPENEVRNALTMHTASDADRGFVHADSAAAHLGMPKAGETAFQPMTREQALTRKVAQLRKVAEGAENTLAIGPGDLDPGRSALHYAIGAIVIVAICVLGVALFAATQAGLFDGLENSVPFLKPNVSAAPRTVPAAPAPVRPAPVAPVSVPSAAAAPAVPAPAQPSVDVAPGNQPAPRGNIAATRAEAPAPRTAARPAPATAATRPWAPVRPAAKPAKAAKPPAKTPGRPEARKTVSPAAFAALPPVTDELPPAPVAAAIEPAADDGEIPAYAKPRAKASNLGEIILRASVQAATNIDKENLIEMYNRYALGFPGLSGEVVIGLTVDPSGRILEGSVVSSTSGVEAFDQELLRKVLDWRLRAFPESRPKFINVPFLFPLQGR